MKLNNEYFILRHGETSQQTKRKEFIYKWPDSPPVKLTKKGIQQVKKVAKRLKKTKIDLIFSSDIYRARQTAGIIAKELNLKINFDKRLRDINLGIYHGRLKGEFFEDFPLALKKFSQRPKKGESWSDVKKRLLSFLKKIEEKHKNKKILIISHGDPLWLLEGIVKGFSDKGLLKEIFKGHYIKVGELRKIA
jgi:broad specificity phosphatase PhoE